MKNINAKRQEGFTLVEVIISIAVLGLISAVVLRLFVLANEVSKQSRIEDVASIYATNAIEVIKQSQDLDAIKKHNFFAKATVEKDEKDQLKGIIEYDENWQVLSNAPEKVEEKRGFRLYFSMIENTQIIKDYTDTALMDINITITQYNENNTEEKPLLEYETRKYFVFEE